MMHFFNDGFPMMRMGGGWIMGIVGVLAILLLVFFIVRISHHRTVAGETCVSDKPASAENSAMKILNERYAKGEINDEEYKNKKSNIL